MPSIGEKNGEEGAKIGLFWPKCEWGKLLQKKALFSLSWKKALFYSVF
jgi:hypothetical protein